MNSTNNINKNNYSYENPDFPKIDWVKDWVPYDVLFYKVFKHLESWILSTQFDNERQVYHNIYAWDYSLIEYSSKEIRDLDEKLFDEKFKKVKAIMSESYENDRQIPEATWSFEYNQKFYLTIYNCNPLTEEINPDIWVYKWIILNPQKYFEVQSEVEKVSSQVWEVLENEE